MARTSKDASLRRPIPVRRAMQKLGEDIREARIRRRLPASVLAGRASINRFTLSKVERGDPGVAFGTYATLLYSLGMIDRLANLADLRSDDVGLLLERDRLPKRVRGSRRTKSTA